MLNNLYNSLWHSWMIDNDYIATVRLYNVYYYRIHGERENPEKIEIQGYIYIVKGGYIDIESCNYYIDKIISVNKETQENGMTCIAIRCEVSEEPYETIFVDR